MPPSSGEQNRSCPERAPGGMTGSFKLCNDAQTPTHGLITFSRPWHIREKAMMAIDLARYERLGEPNESVNLTPRDH
jgi:hypothetical protein